MNTQTIDATNQPLGRLASKIAVTLRGKTVPSYQPHIDPEQEVVVENVAKMKLTGNKLAQKKYYHYSGYPGGLKEKTLSDTFANDPAWVLRHAVYGMLADMKMRDTIIKRLIIT